MNTAKSKWQSESVGEGGRDGNGRMKSSFSPRSSSLLVNPRLEGDRELEFVKCEIHVPLYHRSTISHPSSKSYRIHWLASSAMF